ASRAWTYAWVRRSARHVATRAARAATTSSRASSFRLSPGAAHVVKRLEAGGEVAERGRLLHDAEPADGVAPLPHGPDHVDHVVDVGLRVDAAGQRETDQLEGRGPFLA